MNCADLVHVLGTAGESTRIRILHLLQNGALSVGDLTEILAVSQSGVSRHLRILTESGLVVRQPEGTLVYYALTTKHEFAELLNCLFSLVDASDHVFATDINGLDYIRQRQQARAQDYFAKNAKNWDRIRAMHVNEKVIEAEILHMLELDKKPAKHEHLLDAGTGTGALVFLLQEFFKTITAVDNNAEMLAVARARLHEKGLANCSLHKADMHHLPFENSCFDVVTMSRVLHYLRAPQSAIAEVGRVTARGGRVCIVDFAPHKQESLRKSHNHLWLGFASAQMQQWLQKSGFVLEKSSRLPGNTLTTIIWVARKR